MAEAHSEYWNIFKQLDQNNIPIYLYCFKEMPFEIMKDGCSLNIRDIYWFKGINEKKELKDFIEKFLYNMNLIPNFVSMSTQNLPQFNKNWNCIQSLLSMINPQKSKDNFIKYSKKMF